MAVLKAIEETWLGDALSDGDGLLGTVRRGAGGTVTFPLPVRIQALQPRCGATVASSAADVPLLHRRGRRGGERDWSPGASAAPMRSGRRSHATRGEDNRAVHPLRRPCDRRDTKRSDWRRPLQATDNARRAAVRSAVLDKGQRGLRCRARQQRETGRRGANLQRRGDSSTPETARWRPE